MQAQEIIMGGRVARMRELRREIARLKADNAALRNENLAWRSHCDLAAAVSAVLRRLPEGGVLRLVDGWNLVLGAQRIATSRAGLLERLRAELAASPRDRAWVVFDGPDAAVSDEGALRIQYTGGRGGQRADRLMLDLVRMAVLACGVESARRIRLETADKKLALAASRLTAPRPAAGAAGAGETEELP